LKVRRVLAQEQEQQVLPMLQEELPVLQMLALMLHQEFYALYEARKVFRKVHFVLAAEAELLVEAYSFFVAPCEVVEDFVLFDLVVELQE
jgi:hypothetical protein